MFVDISYYSEMNKNFMIMNQKEMSSDEAISKNLERNNTMWHNNSEIVFFLTSRNKLKTRSFSKIALTFHCLKREEDSLTAFPLKLRKLQKTSAHIWFLSPAAPMKRTLESLNIVLSNQIFIYFLLYFSVLVQVYV